MKPTSEMNGKELTMEAQRLARLAGHARLRGDGYPSGPTETKRFRDAVDEALSFEEATHEQREACAASLDKLQEVKLDRATAALLELSAKEQEATPDSEGSLFAIVARCRAWPPLRIEDKTFSPSIVAERLSVTTKKALAAGGPKVTACAFGVTRQSVYRMLKVAKAHRIPVAP